jgi:hypothetical protein
MEETKIEGNMVVKTVRTPIGILVAQKRKEIDAKKAELLNLQSRAEVIFTELDAKTKELEDLIPNENTSN